MVQRANKCLALRLKVIPDDGGPEDRWRRERERSAVHASLRGRSVAVQGADERRVLKC